MGRLLLMLALGVAGCTEATDPCGYDFDYPARHPERVTVSQGLWGVVVFWEGDFMPLCPSGTVYPVGRELRIHALTRMDEAEHQADGFFTGVQTPEIARVWSDADGFFQVGLPPGRYSLFSVEDSLLYANRFSGEGINAVTVVMETVASVSFDIMWNATH